MSDINTGTTDTGTDTTGTSTTGTSTTDTGTGTGTTDVNREALVEFLDDQRQHVLGILEGVSEAALHAPVLPSMWTPIGMVRHLAIDVEHYWFRTIVGGEPLSWFPENGYADNASWNVGQETGFDEVAALYRGEIDLANAVIRATPLDAPPQQRDEWWGDWEVPNLRFLLLHCIAETACHAGQLDAAREIIDGRLNMPPGRVVDGAIVLDP